MNSTVLKNIQIASGIYEIVLRFDAGVEGFQPGQFAHVRLPGNGAMLLRRPISLNHIDGGQGTATLVYQVKGGGTERMSGLAAGERLDVLAPLGRGFWRPDGLKRAALVGGGIGAAPLRMLPEAWPDVAFDAYLGFRGGRLAYQCKEFAALCGSLRLCSDDGSLGERNFVTCLVDEALDSGNYDAVFACGPAPMLKALQDLLKNKEASRPQGHRRGGMPCQVSLEERMGCGVGACLVCSCKVLTAAGSWQYKRVCKDGPVFDLGEVVFDGQG